MTLLDRIKKTYSYGMIFGYKRSVDELHKWLITPKPVSRDLFKRTIKTNRLIFRQKSRQNIQSKIKISLARHFLKPLCFIPWIELVGITGSVSVNNAKKNDDIDLIIVTSRNTLWLVRLIVLSYLEVIGLRRRWFTDIKKQKNLFCTNLWLTVDKLRISPKQRNLYTAHEVLQILPIYDKQRVYLHLIRSNWWVKKYLANAYKIISKGRWRKRRKMVFSNHIILAPINYLAYLMQYLFMRPHLLKGEKVNLNEAYFHDQDFSYKVLKKHYNKK